MRAKSQGGGGGVSPGTSPGVWDLGGTFSYIHCIHVYKTCVSRKSTVLVGEQYS